MNHCRLLAEKHGGQPEIMPYKNLLFAAKARICLADHLFFFLFHGPRQAEGNRILVLHFFHNGKKTAGSINVCECAGGPKRCLGPLGKLGTKWNPTKNSA